MTPASADPASKLLSHSQVDDWVAREREAGHRIGFTCGSFDLLHAGHVQYLAAAKKLCDRLIVAVNSDESVRRYKDPLRPVNPAQQRMYVIAGLASADVVTPMDDDRPLALLLRWKPDLYIKGGDYAASSLKSAEAVEQYGGEVRVIAPDFPTSTSKIIDRIGAILRHAAPDRPAPIVRRGLVLLDRDGTLIRDVPFLHDPEKVEMLAGVGEALARLQAAGFALVIITNQQGIGLGYFTEHDFIAVNQRLFRELAPFGVEIARIYYCPHSLADHCQCRKPATAMIERALRDFQIPPGRAFLIGDREADVQAGILAGIQTVLVAESGDFSRAADRIINSP